MNLDSVANYHERRRRNPWAQGKGGAAGSERISAARTNTLYRYGRRLAKASTIINFCKFTGADLDYVVDDNPLKQNLLVPGGKIPIVSSTHLNDQPTDDVIIFAWNFAREIMKKIGHLEEKGVQFIVPLPTPAPVTRKACLESEQAYLAPRDT